MNNIAIYPTGIEQYSDIYKILYNNHEQIGEDSLASLGTREECIKQLEEFFHVTFLENCEIK